jgi:hypothetical protein
VFFIRFFVIPHLQGSPTGAIIAAQDPGSGRQIDAVGCSPRREAGENFRADGDR